MMTLFRFDMTLQELWESLPSWTTGDVVVVLFLFYVLFSLVRSLFGSRAR